MAKHVRSDNIDSAKKQPYEKKTHEWYNSMTQEAAANIIKGIIPSNYYTGKIVTIWGCETTGVGSGSSTPRTITAGAVYYNGEIYLVDANTFTPGGSNIGVWASVETNATVKFTDGNNYPVHQEIKMSFVSGPAGGSGITGYICDESSSVVTPSSAIKSAVDAEVLAFTGTASGVPIKFNVINIDTKGEYSASSGLFTAQSPGYYMVTSVGSVFWSVAVPGTAQITVYKVGSSLTVRQFQVVPHNINEVYGIAASAIIRLEAGEQLEIAYNQGGSQAYQIKGSVSIIQL